MRDLLYEAASDYESKVENSPEGWLYPANCCFSEYLEDKTVSQFWSRCRGAAVKLYVGLRSALRMANTDERLVTFVNAYPYTYKGDRKVLFEKWLDGLHEAYNTPPRMSTEREELSSVIRHIEAVTRLGAPGTGVLPCPSSEDKWEWNGVVYNGWHDLRGHLLAHYENDPFVWEDDVRAHAISYDRERGRRSGEVEDKIDEIIHYLIDN